MIAILGILAAMAIPSLLSSKKAGKELSAISSLRTISNAQNLYNTRYSYYAYLHELANKNMLDPVLSTATTIASAKSGYYFTCTKQGAGWWCVTARPASPGTSGDRCFRISTNGVIYYKTTDDANIGTAIDVKILK